MKQFNEIIGNLTDRNLTWKQRNNHVAIRLNKAIFKIKVCFV